MKERNKKFVRVSLFCALLGVFLVLGGTYAWFTLTLTGTKEQTITTGTLALVLDDGASTGITLDKAIPTLEEVAMKKRGYTFTLENTGDINSKYTIYLDDLPILDRETRLEDKYVRYNLQNDQGLNKTRLLSQLKENPNRVLDSGVIAPGKKYTYTLRVWVDSNADNLAMGKVFKGRIRVEAAQDIEYLPATIVSTTWSNDLGTTTGYFWDYKENITQIVIQDEKKKPAGVVQEWDVSETQDETVMAYLTGEEAGGYTLYLQANGPVNAPSDSDYFFQKFSRLESIEGLENFDVSQVESMGYMFARNEQLKSLDLSSFDTSNVTNMSSMFYTCENLQKLNISNFNTSNVTRMSSMFSNCNSLIALDVSSFDTSKVTNMRSLFVGCRNLISLNLSNFDTSSVTDMSMMFYSCNNLAELDVSSFNTSKVTNMRSLFGGCRNLISLNLSNFDTSSVTDMSLMFYGCIKLTKLDLSNFNTTHVTMMEGMFSGNGTDLNQQMSLTSLDLSSFDTSNVTSMANMFGYCGNLKSLNLSSFNTSNVTDMSSMFSGWYNNPNGLTELDLTMFDTSKVTTMKNMFSWNNNLQSINLSSFDTSQVTDMTWMFYYCHNLKTLRLDHFDFSNVTASEEWFKNKAMPEKITVKDAAAKTWVIGKNASFTESNVIIATA